MANVKKVLPIAKEVNRIIIETYEYLQTLPDKKARDAHMKLVEEKHTQGVHATYEEAVLSAGKAAHKTCLPRVQLVVLPVIQAFLGHTGRILSGVAMLFGASLTKKYEPEGIDRLTERVVLMVEAGQL